MPDTELTDRLRDAFALPFEPRPGRDVRESLVTQLPRYRNRKRGVIGGSLGAAAVVVALVLVVALGGFSSGPTKPPTLALPDRSCAELQIGSGPLHCSGKIVLQTSSSNDQLSQAAPSFGPSTGATHTLKVAPGTRITVSLPVRSELTWSSVTLHALSANGPAGTGVTRLPTTSGPKGRTVAVVDHAPVGGYTLVALATPKCPSHQSCTTEGLVWDVELLVD